VTRSTHPKALLWLLLLSHAPASAQEQPATQEPALQEPALQEPALQEPALQEPALQEPALQEPATQELPEMPAEVTLLAADMVVTGTRIRPTSSSFGPSAPVAVIDRKQLEQSGVQNLPSLVQYLTSTQGTGMIGTTNYNSAAGQAASAINLRGLGAGATLLLLNGRRMNPSGAATGRVHFADLSTIPLAAVERIEILRGGASAVYGADAVAGVVNVITRRAWDGARVVVEGQTTQELDQGEFTASTTMGAVGPRSRLMGALSYYRRSELIAGERDWPDDKYQSPLGYPAAFATSSGTIFTDPACESVPRTQPVPGPGGMGELCQIDYRDFFPLLNNAERANVYGNGEFDLSDHLMLFTEVQLSHLASDNVQAPSFPVVAPYPIVPADHIENPNGESLLYLGSPLGIDTREGRDSADDDSLRGVVGLKGDLSDIAEDGLLESWEWELSASFGISRFRQSTADILRAEFQNALNSCSDPAALDNCFNPFYSASDGSGRPNSQAVVDRILGTELILAEHSLQTYNAGATGHLWELPGGELGVAFGGELRREWRVTKLDHDANQLRYAFLIGNANAAAEREVYSGYLELRWPLLDGIELQTAGRIEHYSDTGTTTSPFAGLLLTPSELIGVDSTPKLLRRLQLRANASRAFRAPSIYDTYPGFLTAPLPVTYQSRPLYVPIQQFGNPDLEPEEAFTFSAGLTWSPFAQLNIDADFWHYDYKQRIQLEGDPQQFVNNVAAGYPDPRVITTPSGDISAIQVKTINADGSVVTSGIDFGVTATLGGDKEAPGQFSFGIHGTWTLSYDVPRGGLGLRILPDDSVLGPADCEGSAEADLNDDPNDDTQNDTDRCDVLGKRNGSANADPPSLPRLRANIPLSWSLANHSVAAIGHVISAVEDDVAPLHADGSFDSIPAWFSLDLQYGYAFQNLIGKQLALHVGCLNVFDEPPPIVNGTDPPYAIELHDPRGRIFYARLSAEF
jgi:iron complex outermembrane recepter protein